MFDIVCWYRYEDAMIIISTFVISIRMRFSKWFLANIFLSLIVASLIFFYPHQLKTPSKNYYQDEDYLRDVQRLESSYESRDNNSNGVQKIIIVISRITSGSTFFSEIIESASDKTFYSYEPLLFIDRLKSASSYVGLNANFKSASDLITDIINCRFDERISYLKFLRRYHRQYLYRNKYLYRDIKNIENIKKMSVETLIEMFDKKCSNAKINLIKINRLHMKQVVEYVQTLSEDVIKRLKIILLIRDPRGVYSSRRQRKGRCKASCKDIANICGDAQTNLDVYRDIKYANYSSIIKMDAEIRSKIRSDQIFLYRYEDIAINTMNMTRKLFADLGLNVNKHVINYIHKHTRLNGRRERKYSTIKNSSDAAFSWRRRLNVDQIARIERVCHRTLSLLSYPTYNELLASNTSYQLTDLDKNLRKSLKI